MDTNKDLLQVWPIEAAAKLGWWEGDRLLVSVGMDMLVLDKTGDCLEEKGIVLERSVELLVGKLAALNRPAHVHYVDSWTGEDKTFDLPGCVLPVLSLEAQRSQEWLMTNGR